MQFKFMPRAWRKNFQIIFLQNQQNTDTKHDKDNIFQINKRSDINQLFINILLIYLFRIFVNTI